MISIYNHVPSGYITDAFSVALCLAERLDKLLLWTATPGISLPASLLDPGSCGLQK